jgi:iron-sulfur cluster repair protein YtfE (RIC family)
MVASRTAVRSVAMTSLRTEGRTAIRSFVEHEHEELIAGIDRVHEVACELPTLGVNQMSVRVGDVLRWVDQTLRPHMVWEEEWLFPTIDAHAATPWATRLIRFDHHQISEQAERIASHRGRLERGPTSEATTQTRSDLFALEALLRANVEREERFLLPLLESEGDRWSAGWRS